MDPTAKEFQDKRTGELEKFLYGLKLSPRKFQEVLTQVIEGLGYSQNKCDPCQFHKKSQKGFSILSTHVDDILQVFTDKHFYDELLEGLTAAFAGVEGLSTDYEAKAYVGMTIERSKCRQFITLSQRGLIESFIELFNEMSGEMEELVKMTGRAQNKTSSQHDLFNSEIGDGGRKLERDGHDKFL